MSVAFLGIKTSKQPKHKKMFFFNFYNKALKHFTSMGYMYFDKYFVIHIFVGSQESNIVEPEFRNVWNDYRMSCRRKKSDWTFFHLSRRRPVVHSRYEHVLSRLNVGRIPREPVFYSSFSQRYRRQTDNIMTIAGDCNEIATFG